MDEFRRQRQVSLDLDQLARLPSESTLGPEESVAIPQALAGLDSN